MNLRIASNKLVTVFLFSLFPLIVFSQTYRVSGTVKDTKFGEGIPFANVKVTDTAYGTVTDSKGNYVLYLPDGEYKISFSNIGYFSAEKLITVKGENIKLDVELERGGIYTEEIEVLGEDPAYDIIRKSIQYKKKFKADLVQFDYDAFTKYVIRSNIAGKDSLTERDKLPIFGILESETKGYFKSPDEEKQIVKSKKETANITRGFAIPFIVNFYDEKIEIGELKIPGPVSDNAFDNYEYKLKGYTSLDSLKIFKIQVINKSDITPQFRGMVYIIDSIYALKKVDLLTNDAGVLRGLDSIRFVQKFSEFKDKKEKNFWLPADIQIYADGAFAGILKIQAEVYTVVSDYNINEKFPTGIFDEFIVKVMPDAAEKDSLYWADKQAIRNSEEELRAYSKIRKDSKDKEKGIYLGINGTINIGKDIYSNFPEYYRFNKVEGHTLQFNLNYGKQLSRLKLFSKISYGFSDKKTKFNIGGRLDLLNDRSFSIEGNTFQKLMTLYKERSWLSWAQTAAECWLLKRDEYSYYYQTGFNINFKKSIIPQLSLGLEYGQIKSENAFTNTDFSLFNRGDKYTDTYPVNESFSSFLKSSIRIDLNKYRAIDWGDGEISRFPVTEFPVIDFEFSNSGKYLNSNFENKKYSATLRGENSFHPFINLRYKFGAFHYIGQVPLQELGFFDIESFSGGKALSFVTMNYSEFAGDKGYFVNIENDFGRFPFGNISFLKNISFAAFFNAGRLELSDGNKSLSPYKEIKSTEGFFTEAGISFGRIFELLKLSLGWRLNNYNEGNNFKVILSVDNF